MDPISSESSSLAQGWVTEKEVSFRDRDSNWATLEQPIANTIPLESPSDAQEDLFAGKISFFFFFPNG